jgi:peptidyl-prolyl cis-trans isomerase C
MTMWTKGVLLVFAGVMLFSLVGCEKGTKMGGDELVRVNDVSITLEEFREASERQPLEGKMKLLTEKAQRDFLENYVITREVLYQEAQKKGLDKKKDLVMKIEDMKRAMVIDALLEEALRGRITVSDEEVVTYYKENLDRFSEPEEVKIRQIVVASETVLQEVLNRLAKGESFEQLASRYNIGNFRENGGSLGYIRRGQFSPMFAQFEEAAFSLREKGQVSEVIRTPYGFHLIQLEDKRGTTVKPLNQVKEKIRFFLQNKKRQEAYLDYVREVKSGAKIIVNEELWAYEQRKVAEPKEVGK